jgi:hypothetical protein
MTMRLTVLLALVLTPGIAAAAPAKTDSDADSSALGGKLGKTTLYDFENDHLTGEILAPEGANINGKLKYRHPSLITIRPHFIPQLVQMANDV